MLAAVEVCQRQPSTKKARRGGRYAGRLRLEIVKNRGAKALCEFVESAVEPGSMVITDAAPGYFSLTERGYQHLQTYLNKFTFRFNRRFYPFNAFRSLLGIGTNGEGPTYDGLYEGTWKHKTMASHHD